MRRNEEIEWRAAHRHRNAAMRSRCADRAADVGVRDEFSRFECSDNLPDRNLKRRSGERERHIETPQTPPCVRSNLIASLSQHRITRRAR